MLPGGQCRLDRFGFGCFSTVHPLPVFGPKGPPPVKKGVGRPKKPHEPQSDAVVEVLAILKKKKQEKAAAQEAAARLKSDKTRYIAVKSTVIDRVTKLPWGDVSNAHLQAAAASFSPLSSDCELVDAETSSTMSMGSGSDCDASITEDSSESEEEVSSSDSEKDVHSSEDEYELGTSDDAGPSGSQAVDEGP